MKFVKFNCDRVRSSSKIASASALKRRFANRKRPKPSPALQRIASVIGSPGSKFSVIVSCTARLSVQNSSRKRSTPFT
jgi:hypothetical protein